MQTLVRHRPSFVLVNGRYVRDHKVVHVEVRSNTKGNSLSKFPARVGKISHHQWA